MSNGWDGFWAWVNDNPLKTVAVAFGVLLIVFVILVVISRAVRPSRKHTAAEVTRRLRLRRADASDRSACRGRREEFAFFR